MPFVRNHLYLTIRWKPGNFPDEQAQCGIRFDNPITEASQALVDACKPAVKTFWTALNSHIASDQMLHSLRLARVGVDGKYVPGSSSFDSIYTETPVGGGGVSVSPMQLACAATLLTEVPHGQASKGRLFLPPMSAAVASDYMWSDAWATSRAATLSAMLQSLNGVLGGPASVFSRGTVRSANGLVRSVTGVKVGRRPDVQRSRAKGLREVYGASSVVPGVLAP